MKNYMKPFLLMIVCLSIITNTHAKEHCPMLDTIEENSVLQGKQPWTINWQIFCEFLQDSVYIEVYNLDKESHPLFIGKREMLFWVHDKPEVKGGNLIASNGKMNIILNKKGRYLLSGLMCSNVELKLSPDGVTMLQWCRNKFFIDSERHKFIEKYGHQAAIVIDSVFESNDIYSVCKKETNRKIVFFYENQIRKSIEEKIPTKK